MQSRPRCRPVFLTLTHCPIDNPTDAGPIARTTPSPHPKRTRTEGKGRCKESAPVSACPFHPLIAPFRRETCVGRVHSLRPSRRSAPKLASSARLIDGSAGSYSPCRRPAIDLNAIPLLEVTPSAVRRPGLCGEPTGSVSGYRGWQTALEECREGAAPPDFSRNR